MRAAGVQAHGVLCDLAALHGANRSERELSCDIASDVDVADARQTVVVDLDVAVVVDLDAGRLEPETLAIGNRANRQHSVASLRHPAVVAPHSDPIAVAIDSHGASALMELHPPLEEVRFEQCGRFGVLAGKDLLAAHDESDRRAERREHVHELDSGDA